jgi:hypothetical protein
VECYEGFLEFSCQREWMTQPDCSSPVLLAGALVLASEGRPAPPKAARPWSGGTIRWGSFRRVRAIEQVGPGQVQANPVAAPLRLARTSDRYLEGMSNTLSKSAHRGPAW